MHKLFNNACYIIEALPSDIRCETFTLDPQFIVDHDAPNGYRQELSLTVTYTIDGDSLKITRKESADHVYKTAKLVGEDRAEIVQLYSY